MGPYVIQLVGHTPPLYRRSKKLVPDHPTIYIEMRAARHALALTQARWPEHSFTIEPWLHPHKRVVAVDPASSPSTGRKSVAKRPRKLVPAG